MPIDPKQQPPYYTPATPTTILGQYIALVSQSSTNAPTAVILQNTLSGTPVYTYASEGQFNLTLEGEFLNNKTLIEISGASNFGTKILAAARATDDYIEINQVSLVGAVPSNGFDDITLKITKYK